MATILIVDDDQRNLKLLEAQLIPEGYNILKAASGRESLDTLEAQKVDLVLLDVMMPQMNGFEVLKAIRESEKLRLTPVVLVTALAKTEDRIKGIEAGCDDFISKPYDSSEVLARVKTLLKLSYYRSLLDEKEKFEYVVENTDESIIVFNKKLEISRINKKAKTFLDISERMNLNAFFTYLQKNFKLHFDGEVGEGILLGPVTFDIEREETDNIKSLILEVRSSVIRNPNDEIDSILIIFHDVTDVRRETLMKQDFLSLVSHKLRTPITVITQGATMLQAGMLGELSEKQKKTIDSITTGSFMLSGLIEKLLTFVTVGSEKLDKGKTPIKVAEYLPKLVDMIKLYSAKPNIDIKIDCAGDIVMNMNQIYFDLIFNNLLDNAIKFNDKKNIEISIFIKRINKNIEVMVLDNGSGIPVEEQAKVFDRFYQVEKNFTGNVEGAGLGLALVKRVVTAYGGEVTLKSQLGKGLTFIFILPVD